MPNLILTEIGWEERVRDKLGVKEAYLPNSSIGQPDIIGVAEANIIKVMPDYAEITGFEKTWLEAATVCECAVLLCPSMPARLPSRTQGPHTTIGIDVDWEKKKSELENERDNFLGRLSGYDYIPRFRLAGPSRRSR